MQVGGQPGRDSMPDQQPGQREPGGEPDDLDRWQPPVGADEQGAERERQMKSRSAIEQHRANPAVPQHKRQAQARFSRRNAR